MRDMTNDIDKIALEMRQAAQNFKHRPQSMWFSHFSRYGRTIAFGGHNRQSLTHNSVLLTNCAPRVLPLPPETVIGV